MYPLTENFPKPLLHVGGRPVIDYLVDQLLAIDDMEAIYIVTNAKYFPHFEQWRNERASGAEQINIINDKSTSNDNRLGACADLGLALENISKNSPFIAAAGDNIFQFAIPPIYEAFKQSGTHHILAEKKADKAVLRRSGVIVKDENNRVTAFLEKPADPPSHWICPTLYFLKPDARKHLDDFLKNQDGHDAPGHFIAYLSKRADVTASELTGERLSIGDIESYEKLKDQAGFVLN